MHTGVRFLSTPSFLLSNYFCAKFPLESLFSCTYVVLLFFCQTNIQIRDYPRFLKEIARILRPGGLVLLIEPDLHPLFSNVSAPVAAPQRSNPSPSFSPPKTPLLLTSFADSRAGSNPIVVQKSPVLSVPSTDMTSVTECRPVGNEQRGWIEFWETYRSCLRLQGIDIFVPGCLSDLLSDAGQFEKIVVQDGNIPVGFWPKGKRQVLIDTCTNL
jgi:SAM-dependent methyltransferase